MNVEQRLRLAGEVPLVSGTSSGFGAAIARTLAGAAVAPVGRDAARLRPLAEELGERATSVGRDIARPGAAGRIAGAATAARGGLDILVNKAGARRSAGSWISTTRPGDATSISSFSATCGCRARWCRRCASVAAAGSSTSSAWRGTSRTTS